MLLLRERGGEARGQEIDPPEQFGQWAGPWNLETEINPLLPGSSNPADDRDWAEIAHLVVLPRLNHDGVQRVLFVCRRFDGYEGGDVPSMSFVWDRADPGTPDEVMVNNIGGATGKGAKDPFCGGHVLTPNGHVLWTGGSDALSEFDDPGDEPWGHTSVALFRNLTSPAWLTLSDMHSDRWYPTLIELSDGSFLVTGDAGEAAPPPNPTSDYTRQHGTLTSTGLAMTWETEVGNQPLDSSGLCGPALLLSVRDYPHLHQLAATGKVLWTGWTDEPTSVPTHAFLDLHACGDTAQRWARVTGVPFTPAPQSAGLNSVHLIDLSGPTPVEVVYALGGAPHDSANTQITAQVVKMVNPSATATWDDAGAPDLNLSRINHNTVVGLDGRLIVTGGFGYEPPEPPATQGTFVARKRPEFYKPPEIFHESSSGWVKGQAAAHERRYHSVAGLLPDGTVVTMGGDDVSNDPLVPDASWYSVEVYSPPYEFLGPVPRIAASPTTAVDFGDPIDIEVILRTSSTDEEFRVVLISPTSATHGVSFGQRYVKLEVPPFTPNPYPNQVSSLAAVAPEPGEVPPGWYMLTVVNSAGAPADAKWIQLVDFP